MKPIEFIISFLAIVITFPIFGQQRISFAYDAAGNRVKREIVLSRSIPTKLSEESEENAFFDSLGQRTVKLVSTGAGILKIEIIGFEQSDNIAADIYSLDGILVLSQKVNEPTAQFDISSRPTGTYILNINFNGQQTTWKIAKP